jgi:hypothetical protein
MNATETFTLRLSREDREMLSELADIVRRSQSDTIRFVVRETLKVFQDESRRIHPLFIDNPKQEGSHVTK